MRSKDRFRGCLIGCAAGDALGYAVEFMNEDRIFRNYGKSGITEYALFNGKAAISDDTQMTLFTANGLLLGSTEKGPGEELDRLINAVARCYHDWYITQTAEFERAPRSRKASWLLNIPELFSRRSPGMTCMSAIEEGARGTPEAPVNRSKGCGGVMRVAPAGLFCAGTGRGAHFADLLGARAAALTHGHELGWIPAAALAHIVRACAEGDAPLADVVREAIASAEELFQNAEHLQKFSLLMQDAVELALSGEEDLKAIHFLGQGWVGEEALAIAVFCALKHEHDFDRALIAAVNHDGDSDSTGAVTGSILGARIGYEAIPQKYKEHLELRDLILEMADDLCTGESTDEKWIRKYVSKTYPNV